MAAKTAARKYSPRTALQLSATWFCVAVVFLRSIAPVLLFEARAKELRVMRYFKLVLYWIYKTSPPFDWRRPRSSCCSHQTLCRPRYCEAPLKCVWFPATSEVSQIPWMILWLFLNISWLLLGILWLLLSIPWDRHTVLITLILTNLSPNSKYQIRKSSNQSPN